MSIGWPEILLLVLVIFILFFVPNKLVDIGREGGKGIKSIRQIKDGIGNIDVAALIAETETPIKVFVSSVMSELTDERETIADAIRKLLITKPWLFEQSPPSSNSAEETYLNQVKQADIFILIIGRRISDAVIKEYETAKSANKPILAFIKSGEKDDSSKNLINTISEDIKWGEFSTKEELFEFAQAAISIELIKGYKRYRLSTTDLNALIVFSNSLERTIRKYSDTKLFSLVGTWEIKVNENEAVAKDFEYNLVKFQDDGKLVKAKGEGYGYWEQEGNTVDIHIPLGAFRLKGYILGDLIFGLGSKTYAELLMPRSINFQSAVKELQSTGIQYKEKK